MALEKVVCELEKMVKFGHKELEKKGISRKGSDVMSDSIVYYLLLCNRSISASRPLASGRPPASGVSSPHTCLGGCR